MIEGKVKALFSDKERTELLFPITKTSAITNDDGVGLDAIISDTVYSDTNAIKATAVPVNADTLGGKPADEFATQNYVSAEIAKAQLNGGDVDLSGFATKDDVSNAVNGIDFPVDSVNGKTGVVVLSASEVGATPASHAEDKNNPHNITPDQIGAHPNTWVPTAEQVGAAPAGYGLGGIAQFINNGESLNAYTDTGFYHWSTGALDTPFGAGSLLVIKRSDTYVYQTAYQDDLTMPCMCIRKKVNGAWQSWEWINPPMYVGVEYRTTERSNGSAVYAKRVSYNLGAIDASNTSIDTSIPHEISNFAYLVRTHCAKDSYVLPYLKDNGGFTSIISVDSANITLRAYKATWAEAIWFIDLYYVKY